MTTGVLVTAAGLGVRLNADLPKALVVVYGRTLLAHCVARLVLAGVGNPLVMAPVGYVEAFRDALDAPDTPFAGVMEGGVLRRHSIERGVAALATDVDVVVVHDAARAFTPAQVITAAHQRVGGDVLACAPSLPLVDTVKRVVGDQVCATIARETLAVIHTPQVFQKAALDAALQAAVDTDTDELGPLERLLANGQLQGRIVTVPSSPLARKVTTEEDIAFFTALFSA